MSIRHRFRPAPWDEDICGEAGCATRRGHAIHLNEHDPPPRPGRRVLDMRKPRCAHPSRHGEPCVSYGSHTLPACRYCRQAV